MNDEELARVYLDRYQTLLKPIANTLHEHLLAVIGDQPRIDRISVRPKSLDSFMLKAVTTASGTRKYTEPLLQIQDQIAARVIVFYLDDLPRIRALIADYFGRIEDRRVEPESSAEFGYEGHHYVLFLPTEVFSRSMDRNRSPKVFELQIKTLCQHAWSEASHDLIYKHSNALSDDQKRRAAFAAAQAWGADQVFHGLVAELRPSWTNADAPIAT